LRLGVAGWPVCFFGGRFGGEEGSCRLSRHFSAAFRLRAALNRRKEAAACPTEFGDARGGAGDGERIFRRAAWSIWFGLFTADGTNNNDVEIPGSSYDRIHALPG
jgi:hypothetical protein